MRPEPYFFAYKRLSLRFETDFKGCSRGTPMKRTKKCYPQKKHRMSTSDILKKNPFMPREDFRPGYAKRDANRRNQWNRQYCIITNIS